MTYRIERTIEGARVVFALSGEINAAHVATLRTLVEREATQHIDLGRRDADFFVGFAQRGSFDRLTLIEAAAWQRDLTRVMTQVGCAYGQRHMPRVPVRVDQNERRGWTQSAHIEVGVRTEARPRRHPHLCMDAG